MFLFFLFIIAHFAILTYVKDRVSLFFIWSFFLVWSVAIILSQLGLYGLDIPEDRTITYISIHLLSFYAGFLIVRHNKNKVDFSLGKEGTLIKYSIKTILNNKYFVWLLLVIFVYVVLQYRKLSAAVVAAQSLGEVRSTYRTENLFGPYFELISQFVIQPMSCLLMLMWGYITINGKRNIMWIIIGVFLLVFNSLTGGRFGYFRIFLSVVFAWQVLSYGRKYKFHLFEKRTLYAVSLGVALYFMIVNITAARMGDINANLFEKEKMDQTNEQLISYYTGPIIAFDYALNNDFVSRIGGYKYGALTLSPIEELLYIFVLRTQSGYHRPIADYSKQSQDNIIFIGNTTKWNALYTWCLYFYSDFGIVGLILFPFLFGVLYRKIIFYSVNNPNLFSLSLLCFLYIDLVFSITKYSWQSFSLLLMVYFFIYMSKRSQKRISVILK